MTDSNQRSHSETAPRSFASVVQSVTIALSFLALLPVMYAAIPMGMWIFNLPCLAIAAIVIYAEYKNKKNKLSLALLLSPLIITAIMALIAISFPHPFHPKPDLMPPSQRELVVLSVNILFFINLAWLFVMPFIVPGRKWMAILNSLALAGAHIFIGAISAMLASGNWL